MHTPMSTARLVPALAATALLAASCGSETSSADTPSNETNTETGVEVSAAETSESDTDETDELAGIGPGQLVGTLADSEFYEAYEIVSEEFGTEVSVTLTDDVRVMSTNALPPWEAGEFPEGNNTEMSEQAIEYSFPLEPIYTGAATPSRSPGVTVSGIKFDAGTAQEATCENGVRYNVEAVQDLIPFGLDENNAHVQNDGTYHYHDVPVAELEGDEPELVGFALDGFMVYYSPSGEYSSSYELRTEDREGENCTYSEPDFEEISFGDTPDGTFQQDWEFVEGSGDLDSCNGAEINGEYAYFITDEYPIIPRCLNGEVEGGGGPGAGGPPEGDGGPGAEGPPEE